MRPRGLLWAQMVLLDVELETLLLACSREHDRRPWLGSEVSRGVRLHPLCIDPDWPPIYDLVGILLLDFRLFRNRGYYYACWLRLTTFLVSAIWLEKSDAALSRIFLCLLGIVRISLVLMADYSFNNNSTAPPPTADARLPRLFSISVDPFLGEI